MSREIFPSSSPPGYIPVETTDVATTTIMIEAPPLEPPASLPAEPPLPLPTQPIPKRDDPSPLELVVGVAVLILLFGGAGVIIFKVILAVMPYMIVAFDPSGPEININTVVFSIENTSLSHVRTRGEITFEVRKPGDSSVSVYDDIVVDIFYKGRPLSMTVMEPFIQKEMDLTMVKAVFPSLVSPIDAHVLKTMALYFSRNSSFEFSFDVKAKGKLWPDDWSMGPEYSDDYRWINIWCPNVTVEIAAKTGQGTMVGEPMKCDVKAKNELFI